MTHSIENSVADSGVGINVEVANLAKKMPLYIVQARSDNTVSCYFNYFRRWKQFSQRIGFRHLRAEHIYVALYITYLLDAGSSSDVVNHSIYSIKRVHTVNNFPDPTENGYMKLQQKTVKRIATPRVHRKDPVTTEM